MAMGKVSNAVIHKKLINIGKQTSSTPELKQQFPMVTITDTLSSTPNTIFYCFLIFHRKALRRDAEASWNVAMIAVMLAELLALAWHRRSQKVVGRQLVCPEEGLLVFVGRHQVRVEKHV
jgi:hypothetical protein